jgi:hypothetical protein
MEILIGLALATVAVIGWFYGNLFVCVFLTLGALLGGGFGLFLAAVGEPQSGVTLFLVSLVLVGIAWAPRLYRQRQLDVTRPISAQRH